MAREYSEEDIFKIDARDEEIDAKRRCVRRRIGIIADIIKKALQQTSSLSPKVMVRANFMQLREEGVQKVYYIAIKANGQWSIEEWTDPPNARLLRSIKIDVAGPALVIAAEQKVHVVMTEASRNVPNFDQCLKDYLALNL